MVRAVLPKAFLPLRYFRKSYYASNVALVVVDWIRDRTRTTLQPVGAKPRILLVACSIYE